MDNPEEIEILPLDLNATQAAILVVVCSNIIPQYADIRGDINKELTKVLKDRLNNTPDEELKDNLSEVELLLDSLFYVYNEASKIVIELDSRDDQPKIIQKPNFGG